MSTKLAGGLVEADIEGQGPTLVLFHSLLADRTSFHAITGPLAKHFRVVVPALPGFGASARVEGGLDAVADRMADAISDAGGGAPVRLLGNGYGGFVALLLTIRHASLVYRLVLADSGAAFSEPGREAFRAMARGAAAKGLEGIADIAMRRLFAPAFHASNPGLVAQRRAAFLATDPDVVIAACEALAALDLRRPLSELRTNVLAVVGTEDEATPPAMSRELVSLLPNARLVELDGLAHVPQLQEPVRFLEAVQDFLAA